MLANRGNRVRGRVRAILRAEVVVRDRSRWLGQLVEWCSPAAACLHGSAHAAVFLGPCGRLRRNATTGGGVCDARCPALADGEYLLGRARGWSPDGSRAVAADRGCGGAIREGARQAAPGRPRTGAWLVAVVAGGQLAAGSSERRYPRSQLGALVAGRVSSVRLEGRPPLLRTRRGLLAFVVVEGPTNRTLGMLSRVNGNPLA